MKPKKKYIGTKAQIRAEKERERKIATAIFLTIILLAGGFSAYFVYMLLTQSSGYSLIEPSLQFKPENPNLTLKAAIVDQLSLTFPNQTFMEKAVSILLKANYTVDYFSGERVTVEFYRNLPSYGYKLLILRVHSTAENPDRKNPPVTFFTSERYNTQSYRTEQLADQLIIVTYSEEDWKKGITYFGIQPPFVTGSMNGNFQGTAIIMMGCEGLDNPTMAKAFVQKGAKVYIGWNASVTASHTDTATITLLQHLITEKQTIKQAVEKTMKEIGPDSTYNSTLSYYPLSIEGQTIENLN